MPSLTLAELASAVDVVGRMSDHTNPETKDGKAMRTALSYMEVSLRVACEERVPDEALLVCLPYSEVCVHMKVAGRMMWVEPVGNGMAQLYSLDGRRFSIPITEGEAGIRHREPA